MIWNSMRQRCENQRSKDYPYYGGRGIRVCPEWRRFEVFLADMGEAPLGLTLDRQDNSSGYSKNNCRWATKKVQQNNTRRCAFVELNGQLRRVRDVEIELGLSQGAIWHRINSGWSVERSCTTRKERS